MDRHAIITIAYRHHDKGAQETKAQIVSISDRCRRRVEQPHHCFQLGNGLDKITAKMKGIDVDPLFHRADIKAQIRRRLGQRLGLVKMKIGLRPIALLGIVIRQLEMRIGLQLWLLGQR